jgi:hypothetical protein
MPSCDEQSFLVKTGWAGGRAVVRSGEIVQSFLFRLLWNRWPISDSIIPYIQFVLSQVPKSEAPGAPMFGAGALIFEFVLSQVPKCEAPGAPMFGVGALIFEFLLSQVPKCEAPGAPMFWYKFWYNTELLET